VRAGFVEDQAEPHVHLWPSVFPVLAAVGNQGSAGRSEFQPGPMAPAAREKQDRKSTRLNSSHVSISYAVFCLKKKIRTRHRSSVDWARNREMQRLSRESGRSHPRLTSR